MVNLPEEYVALYLRLNGFLLLTNFTHLSNQQFVQESDIIGLRCPNCVEKVNGNGNVLSIDNKFLSKGLMNKEEVIPVICEVKGGKERPTFKREKIEYLENFFGDYGNKIILVGVSQLYDKPGSWESGSPRKSPKDNRINIGLNYIVRSTKEIVKDRANDGNKAMSWYFCGGLLQEWLLFDKNLHTEG